MTSQEEYYLSLLSVFHYVVGGLAGLFACIPLLHLTIGLSMATGLIPVDEPAARIVGMFLVLIPCAIITLGWVLAICLIAAGRFLAQRKNYTFCLVMAGIACAFFPFGTVLGVFTIVVLVRESVRAAFEAPAGAQP
ncbi:MAG: hypothetical protein JSV80_08745 [Acidobacteriota bacterium]|nr:MAG: hypothetical protein JSV80_08745 [Acidobacteriota bacterium]